MSTKLGIKHPWMRAIKVCSNEGLSPFPNEKALMKFKDLLLHTHNDNFNHANVSQGLRILEFYSKGNILFKDRDVARRLFKARHNMIEGRSLVVKVPGESKVERP